MEEPESSKATRTSFGDCVKCGRPWLDGREHWLLFHGLEHGLDVELVFYCPTCAADEFDLDAAG